MKRINFIVAVVLLLPLIAVAAEKTALTLEENEQSDELDRLLLDQYQKGQESQEEQKQLQYEQLLRKYPDVVPKPAPGTYTGRTGVGSEYAYDPNFANTLFFSRHSSYITNIQQEKLRNIIDSMNEEPALNLVIVGYSSFNEEIEDDEKRLLYSRWISGRRAVRVWNFLVKNGINENRLELYAKGSEDLLNKQANSKERSLNQRVELRLTNQPIAAGTNLLAPKKPKQSGQNTQPQGSTAPAN